MASSRWIYNVKNETYGSIEKYKEKFVAKLFSHIEGEKYEEFFYENPPNFLREAKHKTLHGKVAHANNLQVHVTNMQVHATLKK